jgi:hypothetical protein
MGMPSTNEEMTLLFHYPNPFDCTKYLRPQIKIEFGRGDQQPSEKSAVTPFVTDVFPEMFPGKRLTFGEIITRLETIEHRINIMKKHWQTLSGRP